jgi:hypothetical protein
MIKSLFLLSDPKVFIKLKVNRSNHVKYRRN